MALKSCLLYMSCLLLGFSPNSAPFGIEPTALTREETQYLVGFRAADELRNRAAAPKQARVERLRSKGIRSKK
jgi:hypothetical protein